MNRIRKWWNAYLVRSTEIELEGKREALRYVRDEKAAKLIAQAIDATEHRLSRERAQFTALHHPGVRFTWRQG